MQLEYSRLWSDSCDEDDSKLNALKTFVGEGVASGDLKPTITKMFPFDKIVDTHRSPETSEQIGKIVVTI